MWAGIMKMELSPFISTESRADLRESLQELNAKFTGLGTLNLTVSPSDITVLRKKEPIILVFPNGSLFVSEGFFEEFPSESERLLLLGLEYAHVYLRSYIRNINIQNLGPLLRLYLKDFSEESFKLHSEIEFLRQTPFFPFSKEQETDAITILKAFAEQLGFEFANPLKSLGEKLRENIGKQQKTEDSYKGSIYKRHRNLLSALEAKGK